MRAHVYCNAHIVLIIFWTKRQTKTNAVSNIIKNGSYKCDKLPIRKKKNEEETTTPKKNTNAVVHSWSVDLRKFRKRKKKKWEKQIIQIIWLSKHMAVPFRSVFPQSYIAVFANDYCLHSNALNKYDEQCVKHSCGAQTHTLHYCLCYSSLNKSGINLLKWASFFYGISSGPTQGMSVTQMNKRDALTKWILCFQVSCGDFNVPATSDRKYSNLF